MNCRELTARVTAYLDGDLDDAAASACRGHLRTCAACRLLADDHATIRDGLAALERPDPPPALWSAISARLGEAEIADSRRAPASRMWTRLLARLRPMLVPVGLTVSACAIAIVVVQVRRAPERESLAGALQVVVPHDAPAVRIPLRDVTDATTELADEQRRIDDKFRAAAADLLELARAEIVHAPAARGKQFGLEVARRERAVLMAAPGRDRERAWHGLTSYLETVALGQQVAMGGAR
jgi:Putative zinc-finger